MFICGFYKIYFTKPLWTTSFVFCIFSAILGKKSFLNESPVFQKLWLQIQSLNYLAVTITIIASLFKNVKIPSMSSPSWWSSKTFWKICLRSKRPLWYFKKIPKTPWKQPLYPDYLSLCNYAEMVSFSSTNKILSWLTPLSVKNGFAVFKNILLSDAFLWSSLL